MKHNTKIAASIISLLCSCLLAACSKTTHTPIVSKVSYYADGVYNTHSIGAPDPTGFRKSPNSIAGSDSVAYSYILNMPFSSPKTENGMSFIIYNDSIIVGQKYTNYNWTLNPGADLYNSNTLSVLVATKDKSKPNDNFYHEDVHFELTVDSIVNHHAYGRFSGTLFYYQNNTNGMPVSVLDSIEVTEGAFTHFPIFD